MMHALFNRRLRGFRVVELTALGLVLSLALGVYLAKAGGGRERADIARVEREIDAERAALRLLRAEVAYLEQPERLEALAGGLGLQPVTPDREVGPAQLAELALNGELAGAVKSKVPLQTYDPVAAAQAAAPAVEAPR